LTCFNGRKKRWPRFDPGIVVDFAFAGPAIAEPNRPNCVAQVSWPRAEKTASIGCVVIHILNLKSGK